MIGTAIKAMGRRGILRGAVGLGAAIGIGAPTERTSNVSFGNVPIGTGSAPGIPISEPEHPPWLDAIAKEANELDTRHYMRPTFDGLDLDLAMLRSPSPAYKIVTQRVRDERQRIARQSLWDRFHESRKRWLKGIGL